MKSELVPSKSKDMPLGHLIFNLMIWDFRVKNGRQYAYLREITTPAFKEHQKSYHKVQGSKNMPLYAVYTLLRTKKY